MPDPEQTRRARDRRLAAVDDPAGRARLEALLRRDAMIATQVRDQAQAAGLPVIEVGPDPDWPTIRTAVDESLSPALSSLPRLTAGDELARQRRFENETAVRQLDLWTAAEGITPPPTFDFACECGRSTCTLTWTGTTDTYRATAPIQANH